MFLIIKKVFLFELKELIWYSPLYHSLMRFKGVSILYHGGVPSTTQTGRPSKQQQLGTNDYAGGSLFALCLETATLYPCQNLNKY